MQSADRTFRGWKVAQMAVQQARQEPAGWNLRARRRSRSQRRQRQRFSPTDWKAAIDTLNEGQQSYMRLRWVSSIEQMENRHGKDVWRFYVLRSLSILGGVAITALSGIGLSGTSSSPGIRWTIFALGFLVAGSAAMEQLGHYGQHRMLSRQAREELLTAGFGYLLPEPAAADFDEFRQLVERILGKYNDSYNRTLSGQ
jgi:Protein of unknown function (DUF4231)